MASDRWQLGDVVIWFQTGTKEDAETDSDVYLHFYDDQDNLVGWVEAYERGDLRGFEEGELNCGYLGNLQRNAWLKTLLAKGTRLGVRIENVTDERPEWFVDRISLDFRVGPVADVSTCRTWSVSEWINPGEEERLYQCETSSSQMSFADVGFEKELEIQAGGPTDKPA